MARRRNGHLRVRIEREQIVISIGVATLPKVVEFGHDHHSYDEEAGDYLVPKITDPDTFAKEVLSELEREEEDGTTLVHLMFDKAIAHAIENGAEGVTLPEPLSKKQEGGQ